MHKSTTNILCAAMMLLASSCNIAVFQEEKHGPQLAFETDSEFDEGDLVGLFMDKPVYYRNVKGTYSGNRFTTDSKLYWPEDAPTDSSVNFRAYSPYSEAYNTVGVVSFSVAMDQSTDEGFKASDLRYSETTATASDSKIFYTFSHRMSKFTIYLQSGVDAEISEVTLSGAYPSVYTNFETGLLRCTGDKIDITGHLTAKSDDGVCAYEFIIAPQTSLVTLTVKAGDVTCSATTSESFEFASGMQYTNKRLIVVDGKRKSPHVLNLIEGEWSTPAFEYSEPIQNGVEFSEATEPGVYTYSDGVVEELLTSAAITCQSSIVTGKSSVGYRVMDLSAGTMCSISVDASSLVYNSTYSADLVSCGLEAVPESKTVKVTVSKKENKSIWLTDAEDNLAFIINTK